MKAEAWIFGITTIFFVLVTPAYWLITGDWTGTTALVMTALLVALVSFYLGFHAAADGAASGGPQGRRDRRRRRRAGLLPAVLAGGRCGAACASAIVRARRGDRLVAVHHRLRPRRLALAGWIFEYYRGEHAH